MSWDVVLVDDRGHVEGDWNYTGNTNLMVHVALCDDPGSQAWAEQSEPKSWVKMLHGMSGPEGAAWLHKIITQLETDPDKYRVMDPENGWGDYDSLLELLTEMRNAVPEWPTTWSARG